MSDYRFDLPPSPQQLEAIGMVAVEWSYLESVIEAAIWTLAQVPDQTFGEAITTHVVVKVRLDTLATLFHLTLEKGWDVAATFGDADARRGQFGRLRKEIESLSGQRNKIVHARWVRGREGSPLTYVVQARGTLTRDTYGASADDIRELAARIARCSKELRVFFGVEEDRED